MRVLISIAITMMLSLATVHVVSAAVKASSGESYADPTFKELTQTLVSLNGLDINEPIIMEEYARLFYCDLYKEKFKNDFEWNLLRKQLLERVGSFREYFRVNYQLTGVIYLARYNFKTQEFPLEEESILDNVRIMTMRETSDISHFCGAPIGFTFPRQVAVILSQPITLDRLKMSPDKAQQMLEKMVQLRNESRRVYVRFRVKLSGFDSMVRDLSKGVNSKANFTGDMVSMDMFLDKNMTQKIASIPLK